MLQQFPALNLADVAEIFALIQLTLLCKTLAPTDRPYPMELLFIAIRANYWVTAEFQIALYPLGDYLRGHAAWLG